MTGLSALNPFFLALLPLAALPVVFHLFFRLKKSPRVISTLMFFHRMDPKLNARRRLRERLILLLRTLLILFLLLALAEPVWFGRGSEGSVAVVLVIDNSGSMSGAAGNHGTKLKEAVNAAHRLVAHLRAEDTAGILLLADDPAVPLPDGLTADKPVLQVALDHIGETEASGSVAAALDRASLLLAHSPATHFEIHILSDLQPEKWCQPPVNLHAPRAGTSIIVHHLPSPDPPKSNVSITGMRLPAKVILCGRNLPLEVQLANPLKTESRVQLNWLTDEGARGSEEVLVRAHSETTASLSLEAQNPGLRWASLQIEGDDFAADNRAFIAFHCLEKKNVFFAGKTADFGQLPLAISPRSDGKLSGLIPAFVDTPDFADEKLPASFLVLTWDWFGKSAPAHWATLKKFLESGGNTLIVPVANSPLNFQAPPDWFAATSSGLQATTNGLPLVALDKGNAIFRDLRDDQGEIALRNVKVFRFYPLRTATTVTAVLGLEDGSPLLAEQQVGKGHLFVGGFAFDSAWSTLTLKPGFLALAQNLVSGQSDAETNILSLVAGEPLRVAQPANDSLQIQSIAGSSLDWKGKPAQLTSLPRSGVYLLHGEKLRQYIAVRSSDKEGRQLFEASSKLPALGSLAYVVKPFKEGDSLTSEYLRLEKSLPLTPLLVLLVLSMLAAEGWLANPLPLRARAETRPKPLSSTNDVAAR